MTTLETPIWMTVEEASKKFYPNSYIMINCELDRGCPIAGQVVAYSPLKNKGILIDYVDELSSSGSGGEVTVEDTVDPLDGGSLLVEYCTADAK